MTKKLSIPVLPALAALIMTGCVMSMAADSHDFSAFFYAVEGSCSGSKWRP